MRKVATVVLLCVLSLGLVGAVSYGVYASSERDDARHQLDNVYRKNLSEAVTGLRSVEADLSKLMVTADETAIPALLSSVSLKASGCAAALSGMGIIATAVQNTMKFVNQVSSYCTSALRVYSAEGALPEGFRDQIRELFHTCREVNNALSLVEESVENGETDLLTLGEKNAPTEGLLGNIEDDLLQYPSVIFDGPFSDGEEQEQPARVRSAVSPEQAAETLSQLGLQGEYIGVVEADIPLYAFRGECWEATVTRDGGYLYMLLDSTAAAEVKLTREEAQRYAEQFAKKLDRQDAQVVWQESYDNTVVFNFAPLQDEIVLYPDLFKIKVSLTDGHILAFDGKSYYKNHCVRQLPEPKKTYAELEATLQDGLKVESSRLCLISVESREFLCYEFYGTMEEMEYAVYLSAVDGREKACFRILHTDTGEMVV